MFSSSRSSSKSSKSESSRSRSSSSGYGILGFLRGYEKNVKTRRRKHKKREQKRRKKEEILLQERLKQDLIDNEEKILFENLKYSRGRDKNDAALNIANYIIENKDRENNASILDYFCDTNDDIYLITNITNSILKLAKEDDCYKILLNFLYKYQIECREYRRLERLNKPNTHINFSDCEIQLK